MENRQAMGYFLLACEKVGIREHVVRKLFEELSDTFENYTPEEAEVEGHKWYNSLEKKKMPIPKKITRLPDDFESEISKKNKQAIEILRQLRPYTKVDMDLSIVHKINRLLDKMNEK
jgi:LysM repeat protein